MHGPPLDAEQEVRFAVVLYGGVSLAVYINGVVQELFRLVRSTAVAMPISEGGPDQLTWFADEQLESTDKIYREVGRMLPLDGKRATSDRVRTRFVVDILSGTSAGGINAIFLAKAIANQQDIKALRDLWIGEADIAELLNDKASYKGLNGVKREKDPESLLNGHRLFVIARRTLEAMGRTAETETPEDPYRPSYADEVDLAITTTDLQGLPLRLELADGSVYETRHRNVLRFKYAGPEATGEATNELCDEHDELLAFAARSTSSFPFAFAPAQAAKAPLAKTKDVAKEWGRFYADYTAREADFKDYAFADGGYLDNKPFSYATEALRRRRADVPVVRKLLYVEPDPAGPPRAPDAPPPPVTAESAPDAFENIVAALLLPRHETIREDLQVVLDRNEALRRIRRVCVGLAESILDGGRDPLEALGGLRADASDSAVLDAIGDSRLAYKTYLDLRFETVVDDLAAALVRLGGGRDDPGEVLKMREHVWAALEDTREDGRRAFLRCHDVRFTLRRFAFVQDEINKRLRKGEPRDPLIEVKRQLNAALVDVRRAGRVARRPSDPGETEPDERLDAMRTAATQLYDSVRAELNGKGEPLDATGFETRLLTVLHHAAAHLDGPLEAADADMLDWLNENAPQLAGYFARYESFDMVSLPLTYPGLEDVNPVDVVRIAPEDATCIVSEGDGAAPKLAGIKLGHFGGFLDKGWRRNDILWGRLDGAERILTTLLPDGRERQRQIARAHATILREELVEEDGGWLTDRLAGAVALGDATAQAVIDKLARQNAPDARAAVRAALRKATGEELLLAFRKGYGPPPDPAADRMTSVAGRAAQITGRILEQGAGGRGVPPQPGVWLRRFGRVAWGLVEVATPAGRGPRLATHILRHWAHLAVLIAVILIVAGILGVESAQKAGWLLLGATLLVLAAVWVTGGLLSKPGQRAEEAQWRPWLRRALLLALAACVAVVAAAGDDTVRSAAWLAGAVVLAVLLGEWAFSLPDRRRLAIVAVTALVAVLALAGIEVVRHGEDDVSSLTARLGGEANDGIEGDIRDAWATVWPWDEESLVVPDGVVALPDETGDPPVVGIQGLEELRAEVMKLRESDDATQRRLGDLSAAVLAGATAASVAALTDFLATTQGLSARAAEVAVGVLARNGAGLRSGSG